MEIYKSVEMENTVLRTDHKKMISEVAELKAKLAQQSVSNAPTEEIPAVKGGCQGERGNCRKIGLCENWEPEPQTPGEGIVREESALIREVDKDKDKDKDEDKVPTNSVKVNIEKKSFMRRLFGV